MGVCLGGELLCDLLARLGSGGQRCRVVSSSMRSGDRRLCFTLVFFLLRCPAPSVWLSCGRRLTHFSVGPVVESKLGVRPLRSGPCPALSPYRFLGADSSIPRFWEILFAFWMTSRFPGAAVPPLLGFQTSLCLAAT